MDEVQVLLVDGLALDDHTLQLGRTSNPTNFSAIENLSITNPSVEEIEFLQRANSCDMLLHEAECASQHIGKVSKKFADVFATVASCAPSKTMPCIIQMCKRHSLDSSQVELLSPCKLAGKR
eukprot:5165864-Amphidinium_carterae.1